MAVPPYQDIYNQVSAGNFWQRLTISVSQAQKNGLAGNPPSAAQIAWAKRDAAEEAKRIVFFVLGTAPIVSKLDNPASITDADIDNALAAVLPNLLKAVT